MPQELTLFDYAKEPANDSAEPRVSNDLLDCAFEHIENEKVQKKTTKKVGVAAKSIPITDPAMVGHPIFERVANDAYFTPACCTEALLSRYMPHGRAWEPAAGNGAIVNVLEAAGLDVYASDLHEYASPLCNQVIVKQDFLTATLPSGVLSIVTNPPFGDLAEEFIRHTLGLMQPVSGTVAMFLRNECDCAASRRYLFEGNGFSRKIVLTKRPRWYAETTTSPRHNFSWFCWDARHLGPPIIQYC